MDQIDQTWVSPGTPSDLPRSETMGSRSSQTSSADAPDSQTDRARRVATYGPALIGSPLYRLRPRNVGQLMDGGFDVIRFRPRSIAVITSAIMLPLFGFPLLLLGLIDPAWVEGQSFGGGFGSLFDAGNETQLWQAQAIGVISQMMLMFSQMMLGVALGYLVTYWLSGKDPQPREVLAFTLRRAPVAVGAWLLAFTIKILSLCGGGIALLFFIPWLSLLAPVIANEGQGVRGSLKRATMLAQKRLGPLIALMVLWIVVEGALSLGRSILTTLILEYVGGAEVVGTTLAQVVDIAIRMTVVATQVSVMVLAYVDARYRTEAVDLEMAMEEVFPDAPR